MTPKLMKRLRCRECDRIFSESEILVAVNPFDCDQAINGCPMCKSVDCFELICDEPNCTRTAGCGFPTDNGYRHTCYEHSEFAKAGLNGGDR